MKKTSLIVGLLAFSSLVFAGKSYDLNFLTLTKVGGTQFSVGTYKLSLEGDKAVFQDSHRKTVEVPTKVDNGTGKKFTATTIETTRKDGVEVIKLIHLGGSTTTLQFTE